LDYWVQHFKEAYRKYVKEWKPEKEVSVIFKA